MTRRVMSYEEIGLRYPRLIHAMQWVAVLSWGEAEGCIQDYQRGSDYSGEAVNHFGGTSAVLQRASRAWVRSIVADQRCYTRQHLLTAMQAEQRVNAILAERRTEVAARIASFLAERRTEVVE